MEQSNFLNDIIEENNMMIDMYEMHRFLVEQDTEIGLQLNYNCINENVLSKIWESVKSLFAKILNALRKFKDYLFNAGKRLKSNRHDLVDSNYQKILNMASSKDIALKKIEVSEEALKFIDNWKPVSNCQLLNLTISGINEYTQFCKTQSKALSGDGIKPEDIKATFIRQCPNFIKLEKECNGDPNQIVPTILKELNLPYADNGTISPKDYIKIDGECDPKEFLTKYNKNIEKLAFQVEKTYDKSIDDEKKTENQLATQYQKLQNLNDIPAYSDKAQVFMKLNTALVKVLMYRFQFYQMCIIATNAYYENIKTCKNKVS